MIQFSLLFLVLTCIRTGGGSCGLPLKHYEELGCTPVYKELNDCPSYYDCKQSLEIDSNFDKCYYDKKVYRKREKVDNSLTFDKCLAACYCNKNEFEDFSCAKIDCPELNVTLLDKGCYRKSSLKKCCHHEVVCPPFDRLARCNVGKDVYYEGQAFNSPNGSCVSCVCKKGFQGKFVKPFCKPISCGIGLPNKISLNQYCAPIFEENEPLCCPISWECDSNPLYEEREESLETEKRKKLKRYCRMGLSFFKKGDRFLMRSSDPLGREIHCECRIPPLVTCYRTDTYPAYN